MIVVVQMDFLFVCYICRDFYFEWFVVFVLQGDCFFLYGGCEVQCGVGGYVGVVLWIVEVVIIVVWLFEVIVVEVGILFLVEYCEDVFEVCGLFLVLLIEMVEDVFEVVCVLVVCCEVGV